MGTFNASSDRERGFRIPWYAAVPAVGSLGLAAFSLSRLPGTRRLIHSARGAQAELPRLNTRIRDWELAKQRFEALVDARDHIFAYGKNPDPKIDITKYYRQFLAKGGKIQDFMLPAPQPLKWRYKKFPAKGGAPQIGTIVPKHDSLYGQELYVPYKNEGILDIDESLRVSAEQLAEAQRKKARWLAHIAEAEARVEAQNARLIGSAVLGVPAAVGMLYGNRGNWRSDKTSSLRVPSDKLSAMYQYDATTGAVVGVDIADPKDPSKVITPTIRQLAKQGYPEFKGLLELDRAAGRQTYADYLASGGRYRIKFPDAESVSDGSGFFDITPGKGALGGAALGMFLGGLYADKVNNNPLQSQTQRNQVALGYRALGTAGGALGGYLLGKALSD